MALDFTIPAETQAAGEGIRNLVEREGLPLAQEFDDSQRACDRSERSAPGGYDN